MSFGPTYLPELDGVVQQGRGIAASVLGQQWNVQRLAPTDTSLYAVTPTFTGFQCYVKQTTSRAVIENVKFDLLVFVATCDASQLQLGDLVTNTNGDGSAFIFAQRRPMRETLFVRVESQAKILRNAGGAGSSAQQPTTQGWVDGGIAGPSPATDEKLTYGADTFSFTASPSTLLVPCGIQPQNRSRGSHDPDVPSSTEQSRFCAYIPPLPGVTITENDEIVIGEISYIVRQAFSTAVGFVGNILLVEKINI